MRNFCDTESLQLIFCLLLWSCIKDGVQSVSYLATFAGFLVGKLIIERFFEVNLHNIAFIWEWISMPSFFPTSIFQWILNISFIHILSIFCFLFLFKKNNNNSIGVENPCRTSAWKCFFVWELPQCWSNFSEHQQVYGKGYGWAQVGKASSSPLSQVNRIEYVQGWQAHSIPV